MLDKLAGYKTEIRILERKLKEMDHAKLSPAKVKEVTEAIKNLKDLVKEKEDKRVERRKKKEEAAAAKPAEVEATVQPIEVAKESTPVQPEVTKESDTTHFAIDSKVEPTRGTPGSWGTVIRSSGTNGDPLVYVKWAEGPLKSREEYGAYYESDLKMKVEKEAVSTDYVPREQVYNLEADLKSSYERMIADLQEEIQTAKDKAEYAWVGRLEEKLADIKKTYDEKYNKTAEEENGSGGTEKLKVVDLNPPYDKDPQEKSTGYGGDRPMGAMVAPNSDENSLPLESSKECYNADCEGTLHKMDGYELCDVCGHEWGQKAYKHASLKFADLDLDSIDKRYAIYLENVAYPAARTLTRAKAERIAKEKFPEQMAAGEVHIKREDFKEASLNKEAINVTVAEKLFVVNPLAKTAENEYQYDVSLANGNRLFKITSKDEMGQEHLSYVIEKEILNHKEAAEVKHPSHKCPACGKATYFKSAEGWRPYCSEECAKKSTHPKMAKLTSNLAFLKKGSFVSILDVDKNKKQVKFAALDNSLRGWAPIQKFAAMDVPEAHLIDHDGHKDEVLADNGGREILVTCPANSVNVEWRTVEAPPATPESLNPDVTAKAEFPGGQCAGCGKDVPTVWGTTVCKECVDKGFSPTKKEAAGCDQCDAAMINGVFCHETGCPNTRKRKFEHEDLFPEAYEESDIEGSLNKEAHIRHEGDKWIVYNHDYTKKLGTYDTEEEAQKRLRQIEYFKHQGSLKPLSKKEANVAPRACPRCGTDLNPGTEFCATCKKNVKEANVMETKCEECGKELGPEVFLSKHPVCGKCTKKRHEKAVGRKADYQEMHEIEKGNPNDERMCGEPRSVKDTDKCPDLKRHDYFRNKKKADQDVSLEQQVQSFRDRMSAVTERLSNPPAKTADLETTQDLSKVDVKDLSEGILHMIDMIESKVGTDVSADPELHPMLEDLENKVYAVEMKLGIKPDLPEHEKLEPEHKEVVEKIEEPVEKESDMSNVPPPTPAPQGFRYAWEPVNKEWIMVADPNATGTGTGGTY